MITCLTSSQFWSKASGYAVLMAILVGCSPTGSPDAANTPDEELPAPIVATVTLQSQLLQITEDLPGRVAAVKTAEIRPQVSGIVQRRFFEQGSEVKVNQPLFQINAAPYKAEVDMASAALQRAQTALVRATKHEERLRTLVDSHAISRQDYEDAVNQRDQAIADVAQARAMLERKKLDNSFATVMAPISGRIDQSMVSEGALVSSNDSTPMAIVQQIDQVYVDVRQPASSLQTIRDVVKARSQSNTDGMQVEVLNASGQPYGIQGRVLFSGVSVDVGTGDVLVRVLVDNMQRQLMPGMFVQARIPMARYASALAVPQQAVVRVNGQPHVWVMDTDNKVTLTPVTIGELFKQHYRVAGGAVEGQTIVVEGMERLSEQMRVDAQVWKKSISVSEI